MFLFVFSSIFAETITLKSGKTIEGKILEKTDKSIKVDINGVSVTYYIDEIEGIDKEKVSITKLANTQLSPGDNSGNTFSMVEENPLQIFEKYASAVVSIAGQDADGNVGLGEGFIISKDGLIVTCYHVVCGREELLVKLKNGGIYHVNTISNFDPKNDICVLKIDENNLPFVRLGDSDNIKKDQKVLVIGTSDGEKYQFVAGKFIQRVKSYGNAYLQTTVNIQPGNSGGPMFDLYGNVIGVNISKIKDVSEVSWVAPINEIKNTLSKQSNINLVLFKEKQNNAYALFYKADVEFFRGNYQLAITFLQKSIALDPNFAQAHKWLGRCYHKLERYDEAISEFHKALAIFPEEAEIYDGLARTYVQKKMFDESIRASKKAIEYDPYSIQSYEALGWAYFIKNDYEKAIATLEKSIEIAPSNCSTYDSLINVYNDYGRADLAQNCRMKAVKFGCTPHSKQ